MSEQITPVPAPVEAAEQTFKEMLDESFTSLRNGNIVKGEVVRVTPTEVIVDLGYKSDGIITKGEFSDDPTINLMEAVKPGESYDVFVVRVNDGDGNVLVSKRKVDSQLNYKELEKSLNEKTPLLGKVTDIVKGGLTANIMGYRAFVPASQISSRFEKNLESYKGKEFSFRILELDRNKRKIIAGRKDLMIDEAKAKRDEVFGRIEVGGTVTGKVSRLVEFGAFVDLGGVDGLIHVSEISWRRLRRPSEVLREGQEVTAKVIGIDLEKSKISLSLKDAVPNPWDTILDRYEIDTIVDGTVARIKDFGAFVNLEEGIDGLVHISHISEKRVEKPGDELKVGQVIQVKIISVDVDNRKISLSKREADEYLYPRSYDDDEYEYPPDYSAEYYE